MDAPTAGTVVTLAGSIVLADTTREFLKRVAGKIGDAVGDDLAGPISGFLKYRLKNWAAVARGAQIQVRDSGREPHEVPPRVLIPLAEQASIEDDPSIQYRWASLLAHAAVAEDPDEVPAVFADILSQLTPSTALILEMIEETWPVRENVSGLQNSGGMPLTQLAEEFAETKGRSFMDMEIEEMEDVRRDVTAFVDILVRQRLATSEAQLEYTGLHSRAGAELGRGHTEVRITELGRRFLAACTPLQPRFDAEVGSEG